MSMSAAQQPMDSETAVDAQIGDTLRVLMAREHQSAADAAPSLHMSRSALYARLALTTTWTAAEVKRAADAYQVPVAFFYDGIPGLNSVGTAGIEPATARLVGRPLQSPLLASVPCSPPLIRQERRTILTSVK